MRACFDNTAMAYRIVLATLNAKYILASLGLRYLLANMARHGGEDLRAHTSLHEFTIHRPAQEVVDALLLALGDAKVQIVGLGVYIWNVQQTAEVVRLLTAQRPQATVVLGGPEVSHELETQDIVQWADHVITGWGDVSFPKLCRALVHGPRPLMKVIAGEQPALEQLVLPYAEYSDADLAHRVLYVEASRGCPFKCAFCLSALDKTAWAFELEPFLAAMAVLYQRGARTFKFVDRTFNLKVEASARILQFFLDRLADNPSAPLFAHFELVPDQLPDRLKALIAQFPPGVLQFEIGIQSFNPEVQARIQRRQDNGKTEANVRWLRSDSQAHLHTDLIFGLPGETWQSFAQGFDRLHALQPHEIQLGILKRLRGTPLARDCQADSGMVFDALPPYTVRQTDVVSAAELLAFGRLARYWDLVANSGRFAHTLPLLLQGASSFESFAEWSCWLWRSGGTTQGITPEQLVDRLMEYLTAERGLPEDVVRAALLADYTASGARSTPDALRGWLPRHGEVVEPAGPALPARQQRHSRVKTRLPA